VGAHTQRGLLREQVACSNVHDPLDFENVVLTIRRDGDHLLVQENDEPRQGAAAGECDGFLFGELGDEYTFAADGSKLDLQRGREGHITFPRLL
jgi:hypothetical protein